jgi:hypothetical protein
LKILINPKIFLTGFINPALEINPKGRSAITYEDNHLHMSYLADDNSGVCFYQKIKPKMVIDPIDRFNIDLNKLAQALNCITSNPDEVALIIDKKELTYKGDFLNFKIRTLENEMVPVAKFSPKKLEEYPNILGEFSIPQQIIQDLKKADSFASDSVKFYLEPEDSKLFILLGDKQQKHLDSVRILVKDNFDKNIPELVYNIAFLRVLFRIKTDITVRILDNGALLFITETAETKKIYCTTKLKQ